VYSRILTINYISETYVTEFCCRGIPVVSSMQSESTDLEEKLLSELECPVCKEYMRPPIWLCSEGHSMCGGCQQKVSVCPVCRWYKLNVRNVVLEKLVRHLNYPCQFQENGCTDKHNLDVIGKHEKKCMYSKQVCLVQKLNNGTCSWTGIAGNMNTHLKEEHMDMCYRFRTHWSFLISVSTNSTKQYKLILYDNNVFCCCCELRENVFYSVLQYIGPDGYAAKYRYRVEFFNKGHKESIVITQQVGSFLEDFSEIQSSGNCVKLYADQFRPFMDEESELTFSVKVLKKS
jgi:E3 ubiquitin-protein ligase SIAH1